MSLFSKIGVVGLLGATLTLGACAAQCGPRGCGIQAGVPLGHHRGGYGPRYVPQAPVLVPVYAQPVYVAPQTVRHVNQGGLGHSPYWWPIATPR